MIRPRTALVPVLLCAVAVVGCGGSGGGTGTEVAATTSATGPAQPTDVKRLDTGEAKEAAGTVSVCGSLRQMRLLQPAIRRFDSVAERLQASTLGFPDGDALQTFQAGQRVLSRDCDVFLAEDASEVAGLAAAGGLYDIQPAVKQWTAAPGAPALAPVRDGERVFGLPLRSAPASGVLVLSVDGRNPGGALELVRALGDARVADGN